MNDLAYVLHPSPVGEVLIVTAGRSIVTLQPIHESADAAVARVADEWSAPISAHSSRASDKAAKQLDEFFAGHRRAFSLPLDWEGVHGFTRLALQAICEIPYGETAGYGEVAAMAGSPRAARAVGTACATTPFSVVVPVHRVIRSDGSLGEYGGYPEIKSQLLELERAAIDQAGRVSVG